MRNRMSNIGSAKIGATMSGSIWTASEVTRMADIARVMHTKKSCHLTEIYVSVTALFYNINRSAFL